MATLTTNYQLKKPATSDSVSIADINNNMDIIDTQIKANADLIESISTHTSDTTKHITADERTKWNAMVPLAGGTMTGNLKVGSASIGTNGYIEGTWLKTTASIHLGSTPSDYPVLSGGWIYSRTAKEMKSDLGIKNITISILEPTSSDGSDGDIWMVYE